jgi:hypothetical protein
LSVYYKGRGGRSIYGIPIGIIAGGTIFPRVPGDAANASTYPFPTSIKTVRVPSSFDVRIETIVNRDPKLLEEYTKLIREFEKEGVRAVTTTCGFNIVYQKDLNKVAKIPVFTSTLLQLPLVQRLLPEGKRIGLITANGKEFKKHKTELLSCAGLDPSAPIVIEGIEECPSWIERDNLFDEEQIEKDVTSTAKKMLTENHDIGAILLECHNLAPYSKAVQDAAGLPVFDIITLVNLAYGAVVKHRYVGIM